MSEHSGGEVSDLPDMDEFYAEHFDFMDPRETGMRDAAVQNLATRCPVTRSDAHSGFWVVNQYEGLVQVIQDWEAFSSGVEKMFTAHNVEGRPVMPPIDMDPPIQRDFRHILNPYLTPRRIAQFQPGIRALVTELIDDFIEDGHCDLAGQFAHPFPGRMLYRFLFGIDDSEVALVQSWTNQLIFDPTSPDALAAQMSWNTWVYELVERRRNAPRQDDIIDGLLHATVEGEPLDDRTLAGCIQILILGGFSTTSDSMLNAMLRLAENPELQERLRSHPEQIPKALDEFLRFDPPVSGLARACKRDTVVNGREIKAGEPVFMFFAAANRDPEEFSEPNVLDIDRARNRHLTFGLGTHRCVGSNVARQNLTIALEELFSRLGEFRITPGESAKRLPTGTWGPSYLPLSFTPGSRQS